MSESTDVFVITPNRRTFFFHETKNLNFGDFYGYLPSPAKGGLLALTSFQILRHPQFSKQFRSTKFKFSVKGKKNVCHYGVIIKTSVISDKDVPLVASDIANS